MDCSLFQHTTPGDKLLIQRVQQWLTCQDNDCAGAPKTPASPYRTPTERWYVPYSNWRSDARVRYGSGHGYVLSIDLAREIAAGAPHMIMQGHNLLIIEDLAVGYWVDYIGKEQGVVINYDDTIHISRFCCNVNSMIHVVHEDTGNSTYARPRSDWKAMRCRHERGGQCCPDYDMIVPLAKWTDIGGASGVFSRTPVWQTGTAHCAQIERAKYGAGGG